jgi:hypothetical protein
MGKQETRRVTQPKSGDDASESWWQLLKILCCHATSHVLDLEAFVEIQGAGNLQDVTISKDGKFTQLAPAIIIKYSLQLLVDNDIFETVLTCYSCPVLCKCPRMLKLE